MDKQQKTQGVYSQEMLTKKVFLTIDQVGQNIKQNLRDSLRSWIKMISIIKKTTNQFTRALEKEDQQASL